MLSQVEFKSSAFPPYEDECEQVNPGRFGKRLAEYIATALRNKGEAIEGVHAMDWGWVVTVTNAEFRLRIGVGNYEEYEDGFLCFIEPHTEYVRKWLRRIPSKRRVEELRQALDAVLKEHSEIRGIRWWTYDEFNRSGS
jgi:hypothetical protein